MENGKGDQNFRECLPSRPGGCARARGTPSPARRRNRPQNGHVVVDLGHEGRGTTSAFRIRMRFPSRLALARFVALASILLVTAPALADETGASTDPPAEPLPEPAAEPAPSPTLPPSTPPEPITRAPSTAWPTADEADEPATSAARDRDARRGEGLRLGLDLGFQRAFDGAVDRQNAGTPTLLPLGLDVSLRTSAALLVGVHGYAALASRDDCLSEHDSCRARAYGLGAHLETALGRGDSYVPWIRYGITYEVLYLGGAPLDAAGHLYRKALDLIDLRLGVDFVGHRGEKGKTARVGGYLGLAGGLLVGRSGVSYANGQPRDLDRATTPSAHLWFTGGLRGTLDP
jgi:hypothetical protein